VTSQGPNPYAPALPPPPIGQVPPPRATTGQRLAGFLLIANALLVLTEAAVSARASEPATGVLAPGAMIGPSIIDFVIGISLAAGARRLVPWATLRVAVGMVVLTALQIHNPVAAVVQVLVTGSLLLLLLGDARPPRLIAGSSLFGLYALVEIAGLVGGLLGSNPLRALTLAASGQIEPEVVHTITGVAYPYQLRFPGGTWRLRKADMAKKDQPLADRWLLRTDMDAHVVTIVEQVPGKVVFLEPYVDAIVAAGPRETPDFKVIERRPLRSDPDRGRVVHATFSAQGTVYERYYALVTAGERGFQVIATVDQAHFAEASAGLEEIVESFTLPPDAGSESMTDDVEPAPAGEVVGVAYPYHLTAPNDRWHLRKQDAAKKDQPLEDVWLIRPDRAAHVMVIAEQAPGQKVSIEAYADAIEANGRRDAPGFARLLREPLAFDPTNGRFLHTTMTRKGIDLEYYYGLVTAGDRGFQIIGFSERGGFSTVEKEIKQIIDSFRLPPAPPPPPPARPAARKGGPRR